MALLQPNSGKHIDEIVSQTFCDKHDAEQGKPCYYLYYEKKFSNRGVGVCGERIKKAGFVGKIHHKSLRTRNKKNNA